MIRRIWRISWELPWEDGYIRVWAARTAIISLIGLVCIVASVAAWLLSII